MRRNEIYSILLALILLLGFSSSTQALAVSFSPSGEAGTPLTGDWVVTSGRSLSLSVWAMDILPGDIAAFAFDVTYDPTEVRP